MLELYFLFYRIPKMMSQAARERRRSAWRWSLIGIGVWLFTEFVVAIALTFGYTILAVTLDWPEEFPPLFRLLAYVVSLAAALLSVALLRRWLLATPAASAYSSPPPPPRFTE
jgi:hypothetical protein